jgi:hypothetical protein
MARKPNQQPATAYEWRRPIHLIQMLGLANTHQETCQYLEQLAAQWDVPIGDLIPEISWDEQRLTALLRRLARHALEHARQQEGGGDA